MNIKELSTINFDEYTNKLLNQIDGTDFEQYVLDKYYARTKIPSDFLIKLGWGLWLIIFIRLVWFDLSFTVFGVFINVVYVKLATMVVLSSWPFLNKTWLEWVRRVENEVVLAKRFRRLPNWEKRLKDVSNIYKYLHDAYIPKLIELQDKLEHTKQLVTRGGGVYDNAVNELCSSKNALQHSDLKEIYHSILTKYETFSKTKIEMLYNIDTSISHITDFITELLSEDFVITKAYQRHQFLEQTADIIKQFDENELCTNELKNEINVLKDVVIPQYINSVGLANLAEDAITENNKLIFYQKEKLND